MSYYRECKRAFRLIESLIHQQSGKITEADIVYAVTNKHEIGRLTIQKRLRLLDELGKIKIRDDGIIYEVVNHAKDEGDSQVDETGDTDDTEADNEQQS